MAESPIRASGHLTEIVIRECTDGEVEHVEMFYIDCILLTADHLSASPHLNQIPIVNSGLHHVSGPFGSTSNMLAHPRHIFHNLLQAAQQACLQVLASEEICNLQIKDTLKRCLQHAGQREDKTKTARFMGKKSHLKRLCGKG